jgi:hypothetical protein
MAQQLYQRLFYGYSTVDSSVKNQQFADVELIQRDLINAFYTRPGERVMMPTYGCAIWNLLYEPFDALTQQSVIDEVNRVVATDPRVQATNVIVSIYEHGMQIQVDLYYVPLNVYQTFSLDFDKRTAESY